MTEMGALDKLTKLRALFKEVQGGAIAAYLLPSTDAHQSEYLAENDFRVKFLSGFSGSNAFVVVTNDKAMLWTDGRYFVQANKQLDPACWELMKQGQADVPTPEDWCAEHLPKSSRVAFDPQLYTYKGGKSLLDKLQAADISAIPLAQNLVDPLWTDRPKAMNKTLICLDKSRSGESIGEKATRVRAAIAKKHCTAIVFCELDDIMWLLNVRGGDIPFNPLAYAYCLLTDTETHLFISDKSLDSVVRAHLDGVTIHAYEHAVDFITQWHELKKGVEGHKVFVPSSTNFAVGRIFGDAGFSALSPVQVFKAVKNSVEMDGMREAHIRDSAALIEFLCWLEAEVSAGRPVNEKTAAAKADGLRAQQRDYVDLSFHTISASGDHAALPHYSPENGSDERAVDRHSCYLIDSGAHYMDGTTDVTRTVWHSDAVPAEFKQHNTRVLIGHIENAVCRFPDGILGVRLDTLARHSLWQEGLDFGHGTGHGVGHFLNVHEGPAGIGYRIVNPEGGIHAGMVLTIEPGFYLENKWGIRIENCYEVVKTKVASGATNFLTFAPLTLVPIQTSILDLNLMTEKQVAWLNSYHADVLARVGAYLKETGKSAELAWLELQCKPVSK